MLKQEINGQIKYAQDIVDAFDKAAKGAAANHQAKNGAKKAADDGGDVQYSAMYKSKLHGIEEYYDFVHTNKDNPSERNKSYYTAKMDDGSTIDVLFDVLIHTYNRHALTKPQVCAILDGLDGDILSANVGDGSKSSFNGTPVKLKVSTSEGTAGVLIDMLDNGRNIMRTCFFDSEERIDEWKEKNGFKALTSLQTKESGFLDNRLYISIIRRSLGKSTGKSSIQEVLGTDAQKKAEGSGTSDANTANFRGPISSEPRALIAQDYTDVTSSEVAANQAAMATYGSNVAQSPASVNKDLLEDSDTQYSIIKADDDCQYVKADRSMASDGWKQRKAYFLDFDGKYYDVRISVAAGKDGDVVYHVGQMKERSFPYSHGSSTRSGAQFRETSLRASTVAQSPASVNKKDLTDSDQRSLSERPDRMSDTEVLVRAAEAVQEKDAATSKLTAAQKDAFSIMLKRAQKLYDEQQRKEKMVAEGCCKKLDISKSIVTRTRMSE